MKTFKSFIAEMTTNVPIVSIEREHSNINDDDGLEELNKNLSIICSSGYSNIYEGLNKIKKVLEMYGIHLPKISVDSLTKGNLKIDISPFESSGESHYDVTGPFQEKTSKHFLHIKYKLVNGVYFCEAYIKEK